jgi:hypothetical protein
MPSQTLLKENIQPFFLIRLKVKEEKKKSKIT